MDFKTILQWSEVWAVLIPLLVYIIKRPKQDYAKPVCLYLVLAFLLNLISDVIRENYHNNPAFIKSINYNLPFYNVHSIARLFLFVSFFHAVKIPANKQVRLIVPYAIAALLLVNFIFFDSFIQLSSRTFAFESVVLLIYCIAYFLAILRSDEGTAKFDSSLIIATGLAVYEAVCFPIFLFYEVLVRQFKDYAIDIWGLHNIMYIVFCLFLARAFYGRINL